MSIDSVHIPFQIKKLYQPSLTEVAQVINNGISSNFAHVESSVVDCPDLSQAPFNLASSGLSGRPRLVDLGGPPFLLPLVQRDKVYDLRDIANIVGPKNNKSLIIGAGAGPWPLIGVNCEGIYNLTINNGVINNQTRISKVDTATGGSIQEILPSSEHRVCLLANFLCSEGLPGQVIRVHAKTRTGPENFISSIRNALASHYGDKVVGLGGTFLLKEGKAKQHVMPDFSTTPVNTDEDVDNWLKFYNMSAPLVALGTLMSGDYGLDVRVQHFHSFSDHNEAGHYHYDVTPETVEYLGYFVLAESIYRIDRPVNTHQVGRD